MAGRDDQHGRLEAAPAGGEPCTIQFEGRTLRAFVGEPVAAALYAADARTLARSPKYHRPRGAFCFEGHCASCLMRIDGRPNIRACTAIVRPGLSCERQNAFPSAEVDVLEAADWMFPRGMDHHTLMTGNFLANKVFLKLVREIGGSGTLPDRPAVALAQPAEARPDVCVIGGGPAGLAAATTVARLRPEAHVLLVDDQLELGGSWLAEPEGAAPAMEAIARARALGVRLMSAATTIGYFPEEPAAEDQRRASSEERHGSLAVITEAGLLTVQSRSFICATGAYDQNLPFADNDRPGILSARGCGRLAFRHGVRPGRRVAIVGPSPYGDRLAAALARAGVDVERIDGDREQPESVAYGPPVRALNVVSHDQATAQERIQEPIEASRRRVACDAIAIAATPAPASEVARQLGAAVRFDLGGGGFVVDIDARFATSVPSVFACGDVTGYVGPEAAARAGEAAGQAVAETI